MCKKFLSSLFFLFTSVVCHAKNSIREFRADQLIDDPLLPEHHEPSPAIERLGSEGPVRVSRLQPLANALRPPAGS